MIEKRVNDTLGIRVRYRDAETGEPVDPDTVEAAVEKEDGTTEAVVPTNPAVGEYLAVFDADAAGRWAMEIQAELDDYVLTSHLDFNVKPSIV